MMTGQSGRLTDDAPDLGTCCMCGGIDRVRNIVTLGLRAAVPGHGWGCIVCNLPSDGASAVLCDTCLPKWMGDPSKLLVACRGFPGTDGRVPISELHGPFGHDASVNHDG